MTASDTADVERFPDTQPTVTACVVPMIAGPLVSRVTNLQPWRIPEILNPLSPALTEDDVNRYSLSLSSNTLLIGTP